MTAMVSLALATLGAMGVVVPRRRGSSRGYIFWEAVAEYEDSTGYSSVVMQLSPEALTRETLHHCYELAKVCRRKYRALNISLRFAALGSVASVIYLLAF